jgi:hypothetical protein
MDFHFLNKDLVLIFKCSLIFKEIITIIKMNIVVEEVQELMLVIKTYQGIMM